MDDNSARKFDEEISSLVVLSYEKEARERAARQEAIFGPPPAPEEVHKDFLREPWILRRRITEEAYLARCRDAGLEPRSGEYLTHSGLTEEELELLNDLIEEMRTHGHVEDFNDRFIIREFGNKARVGWFDQNGELATMSFDEFKNAHIEKNFSFYDKKGGELVVVPLVPYWLKHPLTRRYDRAEYLPGVEKPPKDVLNLWRGWPFGLVPGWKDYRRGPNGSEVVTDGAFDGPEFSSPGCDPFLYHMQYHMCGGNKELFRYVLAWMADALLNPGPCEVAIVLKGPQGSGKTFWAQCFMEFFGPHAITLSSENQLVGNFNKHLLNKSVVFADEAFFAGNRSHAAKLKTLITSPELIVEPKGVDSFKAKKMFRLIMASNDDHIVRAEGDDRRYLVLNVDAQEHNQRGEFFAGIYEEWRTGGKRDLFRWLTGTWWREQVGEGRFRDWKRPVTAALQEQKDLSLSGAALAIHTMLREGELPPFFAHRGGEVFVATQLLAGTRKLGLEEVRTLADCLRVLAGESPDKNLESLGEGANRKQYLGEGAARRQYRGYWLPSLEECRDRWEAHLGRSIAWPADVHTWGVEEIPY